MNFDTIAEHWRDYRSTPVDRTIHPDDGMAVHYPGDWEKYAMVGESALNVVMTSLLLTNTTDVRSILDFGCGYGRVARQFRAMFPGASLHLTDIDEQASAFCAEHFDGVTVPPGRDFSNLPLPKNIDLIWAGSVFTHISGDRMEQLLGSFAKSLSPKGVIVATFHGEYVIKVQASKPIIHPPFWDEIMRQYEATGIGHHPYGAGRDGGDNWGISLSRPDQIMSMLNGTGRRCVGYFPKGWANYQDVAVWT